MFRIFWIIRGLLYKPFFGKFKLPSYIGKPVFIKNFKRIFIGEKVRILQESGQHSAMPHPRFKNSVGTIKKKQGMAYLIQLKDFKKIKHVLAKAVHLRKL